MLWCPCGSWCPCRSTSRRGSGEKSWQPRCRKFFVTERKPRLIRPHTEQFGRDEEFQRRRAPVFRFHTGQTALWQLEPCGSRHTDQLTNPLRQTRGVTDQQNMLRRRQIFQPLARLCWRAFVQQCLRDLEGGGTAHIQHNFTRLLRPKERAAISGVKFDSRPLQKPPDFARLLSPTRGERPGSVVGSLQGIGVAPEVEFHNGAATGD